MHPSISPKEDNRRLSKHSLLSLLFFFGPLLSCDVRKILGKSKIKTNCYPDNEGNSDLSKYENELGSIRTKGLSMSLQEQQQRAGNVKIVKMVIFCFSIPMK